MDLSCTGLRRKGGGGRGGEGFAGLPALLGMPQLGRYQSRQASEVGGDTHLVVRTRAVSKIVGVGGDLACLGTWPFSLESSRASRSFAFAPTHTGDVFARMGVAWRLRTQHLVVNPPSTLLKPTE